MHELLSLKPRNRITKASRHEDVPRLSLNNRVPDTPPSVLPISGLISGMQNAERWTVHSPMSDSEARNTDCRAAVRHHYVERQSRLGINLEGGHPRPHADLIVNVSASNPFPEALSNLATAALDPR